MSSHHSTRSPRKSKDDKRKPNGATSSNGSNQSLPKVGLKSSTLSSKSKGSLRSPVNDNDRIGNSSGTGSSTSGKSTPSRPVNGDLVSEIGNKMESTHISPPRNDQKAMSKTGRESSALPTLPRTQPSRQKLGGKPSSRALGNIAYQLNPTPELDIYSVEIEVENQAVKSRAFRKEILHKLLGSYKAADTVAVDLGAAGHRVDHLICPKGSQTLLLGEPKVLKIGKKDGKDQSACCIANKTKMGKLEDNKERSRILSLLFQTQATHPSCKYVDKTYFIHRPPLDKSNKDKYSLRKKDATFEYCVGYKPAIRLDGNKPALHFDFDIAAFPLSGSPIKMIQDCLGEDLLKRLTQDESSFKRLRKLLTGLSVRRTYIPFSKDKTNGGKRISEDKILSSDNPPCYIRTIKLPGEDTDFKLKGKEKAISVKAYFETYIEKKRLKFPDLPYANIGSAQKSKEVWVPLEYLWIDNDQLANKANFRRSQIAHIRNDILDAINEDPHKLQNISDGCIKQVLEKGFFKTSSQPPQWTISPKTIVKAPTCGYSTKKNGTDPDRPKREEANRFQKVKEVGVVHIYPNDNTDARSKDFVLGFYSRFHSKVHATKTLDKQQQYENIKDGKDLAAKQEILKKKFSHLKSDGVLLGLVDASCESNSKKKDAYADLKLFGDLNLGVLTLCADQQALKSLCDKKEKEEKDPNYFPANILRKMNFMAGGINYATKILDTIPEVQKHGSIMIVGAHIARPSAGVPKHSPSVAVLVASIDKNPVHYLGSIRLQKTLRQAKNDPKANRETEEMITNLKDMMQERADAWLARNDGKPPRTVIFYRDSISSNAIEVQEQECRLITDAFGKHGEPSIVYIVVEKHRDLRLQPNDAENTHAYDFEFSTDKSPGHYTYHVKENGAKFSRKDLIKFTQELNKSSQLAREVAYALPVFYAHKLSSRGLDYMRAGMRNGLVSSKELDTATSDGDPDRVTEKMIELMEKKIFKMERGRKNPWRKELDDKMFYL